MLPLFIVVTGSPADTRFAVTEFSIVGRASTKFISPPFESQGFGCVVACSGKLAAVGAYKQDQVWIYDLSNPSSPALIQTLDTQLGPGYNLGGVGAISLDGTNLLVGEAGGPNIKLMDVTTGVITASCVATDFDSGVTAVALKGNTGIVTGMYNLNVVSYVPGSPTLNVALYFGTFKGPTACDFDGSTGVVGDTTGSVYAFRIVAGETPAPIGQSGIGPSVTSISLSDNQIAAGSVDSNSVALITLADGAASLSNFASINNAPGNGGGAVRFYGRSNLVASTNNNTGLTYFLTNMWPSATPWGFAPEANLASTLWPTMGFTEVQQFRILPIPPWMEPILKKKFG